MKFCDWDKETNHFINKITTFFRFPFTASFPLHGSFLSFRFVEFELYPLCLLATAYE